MPTPGQSLLGFMAQAAGIAHLTEACHPPNTDRAAIEAEWRLAQNNLGPPIPNAGHPQLLPIPASDAAHISALYTQPWLQDAFNNGWKNCEFYLVEVDPLLAFQFTVSGTRSATHTSGLSSPPTASEMMPLCLPLIESNERVNLSHQALSTVAAAQSLILKPTNLNFKVLNQGVLPINTPHGNLVNYVGIHVGWSLPHVQVVQFNNRCYLHNGFHRAVGLRMAGATHIPCLFRQVATAAEAGIQSSGNTFDQALLESGNPPTLAHFTLGRAHTVSMRTMTRVIQVNWSEHVMYDD